TPTRSVGATSKATKGATSPPVSTTSAPFDSPPAKSLYAPRDPGQGLSPTPAVDSVGNIFVAWARNENNSPEPTTVWVRRYVMGSGWIDHEPMHIEGGQSALSQRVVVNPSGQALVTFAQSTGNGAHVRGRWFR
ncbi:MAG: hypothetical protein MJE77_27715, partial [Proteobacteria bacterium]|nr:hypothetical protein [Pseudomonadota bacterium]